MSPRAGDPFSLDGEVAVVVGAAGLLGRHMAAALAERGARLALCDLDEAALARTADELVAGGAAPPLLCPLDITDERSVAAADARVAAHFGRCDVLINAAADKDAFSDAEAGDPATNPLRFENFPLAAWRRSLEVNLTGTFLTCRAFGARMAAARKGSIINIGSTYGLVAPDQSIYRRPDGSQHFYKSAVYPASKGGVLQLTRFLAAYWGPVGVRVNALCPGGVAQGQDPHFVRAYAGRTPLGRMAEAHELRGAVVFLAAPASSYVTGATLVVDGGWTAW